MKKYKCIKAFDISNTSIDEDGIEVEGCIWIKPNSLWELDEEFNFIDGIKYLKYSRYEDSGLRINIMDEILSECFEEV